MGQVSARPILVCSYLAVALIGLLHLLSPVALLDVTAVVTVSSMVARLAQKGSLSLPLVWEFGFLNIVYFGSRSEAASQDFQCGTLSTAAAILVLGHCMAVAAMDLFEGLVRPAPPRKTDRPKIARLVVLAIWVVCVLFLLPLAAQAAQGGRGAAGENADDPFSYFLKAGCMLAPTLVTLSLAGEPRNRLIKGYLYSSPILLALIVIGTRYYLLGAAVAPMLAVYGPRIRGTRALVRYGALGLILILVTSAMLAFRSAGLLAESDDVEVKVGLSTEGMLFQTCDLVALFETKPHMLGESALSVAVVLVPRAFWADKPTLIDYWLPYAAGRTGFGPANSISTAYVGDGYADFGVIGVALYAICLGLLIGYGQRIVASAWSPGSGDAHIALASMLLAMVYFAVRSPVTVAVMVVGFCAFLGAAQLATGLVPKPRPNANSTKARAELEGVFRDSDDYTAQGRRDPNDGPGSC